MSESLAIISVVAVCFIALTVAVTVIALFPLARQVREILNRVDRFMELAEGDVRLAVGELREAVQNLNDISAGVRKNMDRVSSTAEALEGFGETIRNTSDIIRTTIHPRLLSFGALLVGLRTGGWYLLRKFVLKKRR